MRQASSRLKEPTLHVSGNCDNKKIMAKTGKSLSLSLTFTWSKTVCVLIYLFPAQCIPLAAGTPPWKHQLVVSRSLVLHRSKIKEKLFNTYFWAKNSKGKYIKWPCQHARYRCVFPRLSTQRLKNKSHHDALRREPKNIIIIIIIIISSYHHHEAWWCWRQTCI